MSRTIKYITILSLLIHTGLMMTSKAVQALTTAVILELIFTKSMLMRICGADRSMIAQQLESYKAAVDEGFAPFREKTRDPDKP